MNPSTVSIAEDIAHSVTRNRREMIETAAHDLHRAASIHARVRLGLPWYIPQMAILQALRGLRVPA
jgi:hypothetical protein